METAAPSVRFCGGELPDERCRWIFFGGSRKQKRLKTKSDILKNDWDRNNRKEKLQVKKWHLRKNDGTKKSEAKRSRKKSDILEKWQGPKKRETKNSKWEIGT